MNKKLCIIGSASLLLLATACNSETKYEQTNTFSMVTAMQSPSEDAVLSSSTLSTITDAYNPDNASATFSSLVLPSGLSTTGKYTNLTFGYNDTQDRLLLKTTTSTQATGFGSLTFSSFTVTITANNASAKGSFEDGTVLFGITNPTWFYSNTFTRPIDDPTADPYETNEYTKNYVAFSLNAVKKTVDIVIYNVRFDETSTSNLNLLYEAVPFTLDASSGTITVAPSDDIIPIKYASGIKGDQQPDYTASGLKVVIYGTFDLPSFIEFSTPTKKVSSTLYEYGNLPNSDSTSNS